MQKFTKILIISEIAYLISMIILNSGFICMSIFNNLRSCSFIGIDSLISLISDMAFLILGSSLALTNLIILIVKMRTALRWKLGLILLAIIYVIFLAFDYYLLDSIGEAIKSLGGTL